MHNMLPCFKKKALPWIFTSTKPKMGRWPSEDSQPSPMKSHQGCWTSDSTVMNMFQLFQNLLMFLHSSMFSYYYFLPPKRPRSKTGRFPGLGRLRGPRQDLSSACFASRLREVFQPSADDGTEQLSFLQRLQRVQELRAILGAWVCGVFCLAFLLFCIFFLVFFGVEGCLYVFCCCFFFQVTLRKGVGERNSGRMQKDVMKNVCGWVSAWRKDFSFFS